MTTVPLDNDILTRHSDELDDSDRESAAPAPTAPVSRGHADKRRRTGAAPSSGAGAAAGAAGPPSAHTGSPHSRPSSQTQYRPAPGHSMPGSGEYGPAHAHHPYARQGHPYGYEHGPPGYVPGYGSRERGHDRDRERDRERERERERERRGDRPPSPAVEVHALSHPQPGRRGSQLSIKPIGFGASRESRKSGGQPGEHPVPSPVVMGFDFKGIDGDQMKTVSRSHTILLGVGNDLGNDKIGRA